VARRAIGCIRRCSATGGATVGREVSWLMRVSVGPVGCWW
jgi:hypothetical protein